MNSEVAKQPQQADIAIRQQQQQYKQTIFPCKYSWHGDIGIVF